jgi:predicted permease
LLLRSMLHLQNQPLGFRTDRVVAVWVGLPRIRYQNNNDVINFFTRVDENLRALPAYEAVGLGYRLPLGGDQFWTDFTIAGRDTVAGEYDSAALRFIDSGFLRVMDTHLLEGRNFSDADDANAQPVTIVSESFARKYWPGDDAIGKYISILRDTSVPRRVVGVVADAKATIEDDPPPTMYVSYKQMSFPSMQIVLLQRDRSASAIADVRRAVQSVDPLQPVQDSQSMESMVRASLDPWRFALSLLGGLAGLAVLLTTVGLFAVVSYLVRERTRELGIRMAIGAPRSSIMRLVLGQSLKLALFGTSVGLVFTFAVVRLMSSMVYAIRPNDPITFVIVAMSVAAISILAAFIPAYRAARVEPLAALREE